MVADDHDLIVIDADAAGLGAAALSAFAAAAGEVPDDQWPLPVEAATPPAGVLGAAAGRARQGPAGAQSGA